MSMKKGKNSYIKQSNKFPPKALKRLLTSIHLTNSSKQTSIKTQK